MEDKKTQNTHDLAIALMGKDIEYIKKGMENVTLTLATMDRDFARRTEINEIATTLKAINSSLEKKATHEDLKVIKDTLDTKVSKTEFEPTQKILSRINWILISGVVTGLLALLYNAGAK